MDGDQNNCYDWFLGTNQVTIQNGQGMFHNLFTSQFRDLTYLQQIETIEKLYHLIAMYKILMTKALTQIILKVNDCSVFMSKYDNLKTLFF